MTLALSVNSTRSIFPETTVALARSGIEASTPYVCPVTGADKETLTGSWGGTTYIATGGVAVIRPVVSTPRTETACSPMGALFHRNAYPAGTELGVRSDAITVAPSRKSTWSTVAGSRSCDVKVAHKTGLAGA